VAGAVHRGGSRLLQRRRRPPAPFRPVSVPVPVSGPGRVGTSAGDALRILSGCRWNGRSDGVSFRRQLLRISTRAVRAGIGDISDAPAPPGHPTPPPRPGPHGPCRRGGGGAGPVKQILSSCGRKGSDDDRSFRRGLLRISDGAERVRRRRVFRRGLLRISTRAGRPAHLIPPPRHPTVRPHRGVHRRRTRGPRPLCCPARPVPWSSDPREGCALRRLRPPCRPEHRPAPAADQERHGP